MAFSMKRKEEEMLRKVREQYTREQIEDYSTDVIVDWLEGRDIKSLTIETEDQKEPKDTRIKIKTISTSSTLPGWKPTTKTSSPTKESFNDDFKTPQQSQPPTSTKTNPKELTKHLTKGFNFVSPLGPGTFEKTALGTTRSMNKTEEYTREIFEFIFGKGFPSIRPNWLTSPATGRRCELDGYLEKVGLRGTFGKSRVKNSLHEKHKVRFVGVAFEYDGDQHAKYKPGFHKSKKDFVYQFKRDRWKDKKVKDRGIILIRIPHTIKKPHICEYLVNELKKKGLEGYAQILHEHIHS